MSAEATGWVFKHSPFKGLTFTVHLAIADSVNDQNNNEFWLRADRLAIKTRAGRSAVQESLRALRENGYLEQLDEGGGRSRPARYRFIMPRGASLFYDPRQRARESRSYETVRRRGGKGAIHTPKGRDSRRGKEPKEPNEPKDGERAAQKVRSIIDDLARKKAMG